MSMKVAACDECVAFCYIAARLGKCLFGKQLLLEKTKCVAW